MRSHGTDAPREIYQFGKRGERSFDVIEKYIKLRYRLLALYLYPHCVGNSKHPGQVTFNGVPLVDGFSLTMKKVQKTSPISISLAPSVMVALPCTLSPPCM